MRGPQPSFPIQGIAPLQRGQHAALIGCVVIVLVMLSTGASTLFGGREDAQERAVARSSSALPAMERALTQVLHDYDRTLQRVAARADSIEAQRLGAPGRTLFGGLTPLPCLGSIVVRDEHGLLIADSAIGAGTMLRADAGTDRQPYLTPLRRDPGLGLYVGAEHRAGQPTMLMLSRRVDKRNGAFGGVVTGAVDAACLRRLLPDLPVGPHGQIALLQVSDRGVQPIPDFSGAVIGLDGGGAEPLGAMSASAKGAFSDDMPVQGERRLYFFKHLDGLPLMLAVSFAEDDVYRAWRAHAIGTAAFMLACTVVFLGLAGYLALLISRRNRIVVKLQQLARLDELTRLDNRRSFDDRLTTEWRRAARDRRPLSVLFVDIDHFKNYNDSYGHQAGDAALTAVARCIGANLRRPADFAARYGGEEFVVVLPDTDETGAHAVAQTLRRAVDELDINCPGAGRHVTVSIGAATRAAHTEREPSALVKAADEALYLAKAAGRNRVFVARLA